MINSIKKTLLVISFSIFLLGCGGKTALISTPIENIDAISIKNNDLSDAQLKDWKSLDILKDTVPGMSVEKTYKEIIKNRKGQSVIVAIIDSGVDIEHEDLDDVLWVNTAEIKGNGKDDDNNGYIDDIHGWNFLGDSVDENLEFVRIIKKLKPKYTGKTLASIDEKDKEEYQQYIQAKVEYEEKYNEALGSKVQYEGILAQMEISHKAVSEALGKEDYSPEELSGIEDYSQEMQQHMAFISQMFGFLEQGEKIPEFKDNLKEGVEYFTNQLNYNLNATFDGRKSVGDNVDDIKDNTYGNNNVLGPDPEKDGLQHGTHVAGIVAAERDNQKGARGVAENVQIMTIRAVPDGDEYDKDIALGIRYAADNGAKVINTSFGKSFSTHPEWVWDAIKYAAEKDVLIVNAAGNESYDLDQKIVFPNDQTELDNEIADNFITIGALNYKYGSELMADFSNYGKNNVDAFAPGVKIWSTTPNNSYEYLQGTSMAAPAVSGVAAMIRSFYPKLKAAQVKQLLMNSGLPVKTSMILAGNQTKTVKLSEISKSGKIVNMFNAFIMAEKMSK